MPTIVFWQATLVAMSTTFAHSALSKHAAIPRSQSWAGNVISLPADICHGSNTVTSSSLIWASDSQVVS